MGYPGQMYPTHHFACTNTGCTRAVLPHPSSPIGPKVSMNPEQLRTQPAQLPDIMATFLDVAGADYPEVFDNKPIKPLEGFSLVPAFNGKPLHTRKLVSGSTKVIKPSAKGNGSWCASIQVNGNSTIWKPDVQKSTMLPANIPKLSANSHSYMMHGLCDVVSFHGMTCWQLREKRNKKENPAW